MRNVKVHLFSWHIALLLSRRSESLLYDRIDIYRIRHGMLSNGLLVLLGQKQEHSILEVLPRGDRRSRSVGVIAKGHDASIGIYWGRKSFN